MPQQRATSANNGLPQRFGTSPRLVFDTFRFVTSIAEQSRAKSCGTSDLTLGAERRQASDEHNAYLFFYLEDQNEKINLKNGFNI
jgi:hypothetical protein